MLDEQSSAELHRPGVDEARQLLEAALSILDAHAAALPALFVEHALAIMAPATRAAETNRH